MSAVSSVSTPGVFVTRIAAVARRIEIDVVDAGAEIGDQPEARTGLATDTARSMRSVTVGTRTSAVLTASTSWAWVIGLSSTFKSRVEQFAHARFDNVGQFAGDDDNRFLSVASAFAFRCRKGAAIAKGASRSGRS